MVEQVDHRVRDNLYVAYMLWSRQLYIVHSTKYIANLSIYFPLLLGDVYSNVAKHQRELYHQRVSNVTREQHD